MTDHELEQRLQRIDPVPTSASVDPVDGPRARALMEQIMTTSPTETSAVEGPAPPRRRWSITLAGAAAAVAIGITVAVVSGGPSDEPVAATYALQATDLMAMCLAVDEAPPPPSGAVAFAGTVTAVTSDGVTLDVDRTYAGEEADVVTLATGPEVTAVELDGVEFVTGERYLITVVDGLVQICGVSGPASPELEAIYDRWFGG